MRTRRNLIFVIPIFTISCSIKIFPSGFFQLLIVSAVLVISLAIGFFLLTKNSDKLGRPIAGLFLSFHISGTVFVFLLVSGLLDPSQGWGNIKNIVIYSSKTFLFLFIVLSIIFAGLYFFYKIRKKD